MLMRREAVKIPAVHGRGRGEGGAMRPQRVRRDKMSCRGGMGEGDVGGGGGSAILVVGGGGGGDLMPEGLEGERGGGGERRIDSSCH